MMSIGSRDSMLREILTIPEKAFDTNQSDVSAELSK